MPNESISLTMNLADFLPFNALIILSFFLLSPKSNLIIFNVWHGGLIMASDSI